MTTKAEERKALEQIRKIVEGLGERSYIGMAFEGCFEDAEKNIENDWGCSMKQRIDSLENELATEKQACDLRREQAYKLEEELKLAKQTIEQERSSKHKLIDKLTELRDEARDADKRIWDLANEKNALKETLEAKDQEIIKLKAKLYDLMAK